MTWAQSAKEQYLESRIIFEENNSENSAGLQLASEMPIHIIRELYNLAFVTSPGEGTQIQK